MALASRSVSPAIISQAASSGTNFIAVTMMARTSSVEQFGILSAVYSGSLLTVGLYRSLYLEEHLGTDRGSFPGLATPLLFGGLLGLCGFVATLTFTSSSVALGGLAIYPLVALFEHERLLHANSDRLLQTALMDAAWLALVILVAALTFTPAPIDGATVLVLYGLSAGIVGTLAHANREMDDSPSRGPVPTRQGVSLVVEYMADQALLPMIVIAGAVFFDPRLAAGLRGADTLFGPATVIVMAARFLLLPTLHGSSNPKRDTARLGNTTAAFVGLWFGLLWVLPPDVGRVILGDSLSAAASILPAIAFLRIFLALELTALLRLRLQGSYRTSRRLRVFGLAIVVLFGIAGAMSREGEFFVWSFVLARSAVAVIWRLRERHERRRLYCEATI